jgi:hypothetical protein
MNRALLFQAMEPYNIPKGGPPTVQSMTPKVNRAMHDQQPTNRNPLLQQIKAPLGPIKPLHLWGVNDYNTGRGVLNCASIDVKVLRTPNPTPPNVVNIIGGQSRSQNNSICNGFRPLDLPLQPPTWSLSGARPVQWAVRNR